MAASQMSDVKDDFVIVPNQVAKKKCVMLQALDDLLVTHFADIMEAWTWAPPPWYEVGWRFTVVLTGRVDWSSNIFT